MKSSFIMGSCFVATVLLSSFGSIKETPIDNSTVFIWHEYNYAGNAEIYPAVTFEGTEYEATMAFGCVYVGPKICARAYLLNFTPTEYFITKY